MSDILNYPGTDTMHPPDRSHEIIVWFSLDSLSDYWKAFGPIAEHVLPVQRAAKQAVSDFHNAPGGPGITQAFASHLPDAIRARVTGMIARIERTTALPGLAYWEGLAAQAQNDADLTGLEAPVSVDLMTAYKQDYRAKQRESMDDLRTALGTQPLSDWDMQIHTIYGYCTYETARFSESVLLSGLSRLAGTWQFLEWIDTEVRKLSAQDRALLHTAVQDEAREILDAPLESPIEQAVYGDVDVEREIDAIPPAEALMSA